jgi:hypothetical protein
MTRPFSCLASLCEGGDILEPRFSTLRKLARALDVEPRTLHPDED